MKRISKKKIRIFGFISILFVFTFSILIPIFGNWGLTADGIHIDLKIRYLGDISVGTPILLSSSIPAGFVKEIVYDKAMKEIYLKVFLNETIKNNPHFVKSNRTIFVTLSRGFLQYRYLGLLLNEENYQKYERIQNNDKWYVLDGMSLQSFSQDFASTLKEEEYEKKQEIGFGVIREKTNNLLKNLENFQNSNKKDLIVIQKSIDSLSEDFSFYFSSMQKNYNAIEYMVTDYGRLGEISLNQAIEFYDLMFVYVDDIFDNLKTNKYNIGKFSQDKELYKNIADIRQYSQDFLKCIRKKPRILFQVNSTCNSKSKRSK